MKLNYNSIGLINYEGDCLKAIKRGDQFEIVDQWGKINAILEKDGVVDFLDGRLLIKDSEGKEWCYPNESGKIDRSSIEKFINLLKPLEVAAANLADPNLCKTDNWIAGAKWQAEKMYSEEDLRQAFRDGQSNMHYSNIFGLDRSLTEQQWFENFKKK
jgi:hypothetical protein